MFEELLALQESETSYTGAASPVPVRVSAVGEFEALLTKVKVAVTAPVAVGVNVTVNGTGVPGVTVAGKLSPLRLKTALFALAEVTVTLAPEAVRLPEAEPFVPTTTLPSARVDGETASCPGAAVPVPDNAIPRDGFDPFEVTVTVPLALPAEVGVNVT
jgi:hypothetical protein